MKILFIIIFFANFSSCSNGTNNARSNLYEINESYLKLEETEDYFYKSYASDNYPTNEIDYIDTDIFEYDYNTTDVLRTFVTTKRIGESLPYFTFTRILGDYLDDSLIYQFPMPVETTIVIEDDEGNVVQVISGLSQSGIRELHHYEYDLTFDDYNFDGYLDMRLKRWQDGARGLLANEYFWLWDMDKLQFVLNEQLVEIGHAAGLRADSSSQQIVVRQRNGALSNFYFYEYINELFELVAYEYLSRVYYDGEFSHLASTHTNTKTGEITVVVLP